MAVSTADFGSLFVFISSADSREVGRARVLAALKAVGKRGKVVIQYSGHPPELSPAERERALLVSTSDASYPWVRDLALGWRKRLDGRFQATASDLTQSAASEVATVLSLCAPEIAPSQVGVGQASGQQGGNLVSDGAGMCVLGEGLKMGFSAGQSVAEMEAVYAEAAGCKRFVWVPGRDAWPAGHSNGHADLLVTMPAPGIAIVPSIGKTCGDAANQQFGKVLDTTVDRLVAQGIKVYRAPVAGDCVQKDSGGHLLVRSYANMEATAAAYVVPEYQPKHESSNRAFVALLGRLIEDGVITKKEIIPYPVTEDNVSAGGAARCMTFPIPSELGACTQTSLDQAIVRVAREAERIGDRLCADSPNPAICRLSREMLEAMSAMQSPFAYRPDLVTSVIDEPKEERQMSGKLRMAISRLKHWVDLVCGDAPTKPKT